jgi:hypothetical protein
MEGPSGAETACSRVRSAGEVGTDRVGHRPARRGGTTRWQAAEIARQREALGLPTRGPAYSYGSVSDEELEDDRRAQRYVFEAFETTDAAVSGEPLAELAHLVGGEIQSLGDPACVERFRIRQLETAVEVECGRRRRRIDSDRQGAERNDDRGEKRRLEGSQRPGRVAAVPGRTTEERERRSLSAPVRPYPLRHAPSQPLTTPSTIAELDAMPSPDCTARARGRNGVPDPNRRCVRFFEETS